MLDRAEAAAQARLLGHARAVRRQFGELWRGGALVREHPYASVALAAGIGAAAAPILLRVLRAPGPALRAAGRALKLAGFATPLASRESLLERARALLHF